MVHARRAPARLQVLPACLVQGINTQPTSTAFQAFCLLLGPHGRGPKAVAAPCPFETEAEDQC
eukprot:11835404-Alexandrium_andersonii.AAC.1